MSLNISNEDRRNRFEKNLFELRSFHNSFEDRDLISLTYIEFELERYTKQFEESDLSHIYKLCRTLAYDIYLFAILWDYVRKVEKGGKDQYGDLILLTKWERNFRSEEIKKYLGFDDEMEIWTHYEGVLKKELLETGTIRSEETYRTWVFTLHGLCVIHRKYNNLRKDFECYYRFLSIFIQTEKTNLKLYEEQFICAFNAFWISALESEQQMLFKNALKGLIEKTKCVVKFDNFNHFRVNCLYATGEYKKALKFARQTLKDCRKGLDFVLPDLYLDYWRQLDLGLWLPMETQFLMKIAFLHKKLRNYDLALQTYKKVLESGIDLDYSDEECIHCNSNVNIHAKPFCLFQCGLICVKKEDYENAKYYFENCEKCFSELLRNVCNTSEVFQLKVFFGRVYVTLMYYQTAQMIPLCEAGISRKKLMEQTDQDKEMLARERKRIRMRQNSRFIGRVVDHTITVLRNSNHTKFNRRNI